MQKNISTDSAFNGLGESDLLQYMVFRLSKEDYGVEIKKINTITMMSPVTRVSGAPHYIKGVINLRGDIIPVIGFRERFGLPPMEYNENTRIIIFNINGSLIGGIVDSVAEVVVLKREDIEGVGNIQKDISLDFIEGVGKLTEKIITILNLEKVLESIDSEMGNI